jgi:hypothetical protein
MDSEVSVSSWFVWRWSSWMSSRIFSTFSVILLVLDHPERSSSSTDTRPALKRECHSKTTLRLKEYYPKSVLVAHLPSFTQILIQTCCSILPSIAAKRTHEVEKALMYKEFMFTARCHMADWSNRLAEVCPWPPLSSFYMEAVTTIRVPELFDRTLYVVQFQWNIFVWPFSYFLCVCFWLNGLKTCWDVLN